MKLNKKTVIITSIVMLIPLFVGLFLWNELPNEIATHFNSNGVADRYDSKVFTIIGLPLFLLAIHLFCIFASKKDFENAGKKMASIVLWICPTISLIVMFSIYAKAMYIDFNVTFIAMTMVSFITIIIGNYLPKIKQNSTIGIKIPSTLNSEENWYRTHRFTGKLWVITGLIMLFMTFLKVNLGYAILIWLLIDILAPITYSFIISKKEKNIT